jgi:hypothetical protein
MQEPWYFLSKESDFWVSSEGEEEKRYKAVGKVFVRNLAS